MRRPKESPWTRPLDRAGELLLEIRMLKAEISVLEGNAERKISEIRSGYFKEIGPRGEKPSQAEKNLMEILRENKEEIFSATDKIELLHGWLFFAKIFKLKIPRRTLARIEAEGWDEAIRTSKSLDRGVIESWPLWRLEKVGISKEEVETFSYEVRANGLKEGE